MIILVYVKSSMSVDARSLFLSMQPILVNTVTRNSVAMSTGNSVLKSSKKRQDSTPETPVAQGPQVALWSGPGPEDAHGEPVEQGQRTDEEDDLGHHLAGHEIMRHLNRMGW
jgi:hypothetical protein